MPLSDKMLKELMTTFQAELQEHLGTLNNGLLSLERNSAPDERASVLSEIFRAAHSIKGAARAVNLKDIETIAHRVEDFLTRIRKGDVSLTPRHFDTLLTTVDAINTAMSFHLRSEQMPAEAMAAILTHLDDAASSSAVSVPSDANSSSAKSAAATPPGPLREQPQIGPRPTQADETIRVRTAKLDALMDGLGELLVMQMRTEKLVGQMKGLQERTSLWQKNWRKARPHYNRLRRHSPKVDKTDLTALFGFLEKNEQEIKTLSTEQNMLLERLTNDRNYLQLVTEDLQNGIRRARMLPIATLFDLFPRMIRDLGHALSKDIILEVQGQETELDRQALELLKDPLTHLLRNAVDHGIESPEERVALGKPRRGTIRLCAEQRGNGLLLTVSDDGRGINLDAVRRSATERGLVSSEKIAEWSERELVDLIFYSGLSTAGQTTDLSGRGVGMDVVRKNLEQLHGSIEVETRPRLGTTFAMVLPLTLTTSQVLLVRTAGETVGLPMMNVDRMVYVSVPKVGNIEGHPAIHAEGRLLPLVSLSYLLNLPEVEQPLTVDAKIPVVILSMAEKHIALRVGGFLSTQEVVVKPLGSQLRRVRNVAGTAILGDGQLVLILNISDLMKSIDAKSMASLTQPIATKEARRSRVLLVDDSITTRTLEKHILENAGYEVLTAADGQEAWELICQNEKGLPDLVISDINMPRMDGFVLTQSVKGDRCYAHVPMILVTSLDSPQDRLHGMEAGADAYIVKSTFDQRELLETIERLIR